MRPLDRLHFELAWPLRYALGGLFFLLALLLRLWAMPVEAGLGFLTFYPATVIAFYLLGIGPGCVLVVIGALAGHFIFTAPYWSFAFPGRELLPVLVFVASQGLIGGFIWRLQLTSQRLDAARNALLDSEQRYLAMLEDQSDVICRYQFDGTVLYVNQSFCSTFGVQREDIVGHTWFNLAVPEDLPLVQAALAQLSPANPMVTLVNRVVVAWGQVRWFNFADHAIFDAQGRLMEIQAVGRDVTEQRQARADLADLYDNAPCGYHSLDAEGRFARINDRMLDWLGCRRDEVIGKLGPADFFTPEDQMQFWQSFRRFKSLGFAGPMEFDLCSRDGSVRRVSVSATAIKDEHGNYLTSRSVVHDITELQLARLQGQQLLLEQLAMINTNLVGVSKLSQRQIVWANAGVAEIFGYGLDELTGQSIRMLYFDDVAFEAFGRAAYPALSAGETFRTQLLMRRKDGSAVWIDAFSSRLASGEGDSMCLMTDISALKQAEDMRHKAIQLEAENRSLHASNQLKDRFVSNMSHELRTPLNAVIGLAQILQSGTVSPRSPEFGEYLGDIVGSGLHLLQLIDNILVLGNVESGKLQLVSETVNLQALVRDLIALHRTETEREDIVFAVEIDAEIERVEIDALRCQQALSSYLSNACKFTGPAGHVTIRAAALDAQNFRIEVEDDGPGIDPADLPRLFNKFDQLSSGYAKQHPGTGLGLALARRLVEALGGTVGVRSLPGKGSVFHMVLPRKPLSAGAAPERSIQGDAAPLGQIS